MTVADLIRQLQAYPHQEEAVLVLDGEANLYEPDSIERIEVAETAGRRFTQLTSRPTMHALTIG
ncbi:MAG: hypothetical protein GC182_03115 [Rhodopseudomonas sp.]|nr:hypothetical protein [Rhodopseudomonas sp.]